MTGMKGMQKTENIEMAKFTKHEGEWCVVSNSGKNGDIVQVAKRDGSVKSMTLGEHLGFHVYRIAGQGKKKGSEPASGNDNGPTEKQKNAIRTMARYMESRINCFDSSNENPVVLANEFIRELDSGVSKKRASEMIKEISFYIDDEM